MVVGIDNRPQARFPYEFVRDDALDVLRRLIDGEMWNGYVLGDFCLIHASPPCQHYAPVTSWRGDQDDHPAMIEPTRDLLQEAGLPWVIENVPWAPVRLDYMLCGSMFGLRVRRHRKFEVSWTVDSNVVLPECSHASDDYSFDHGAKQPESVYRDAMGCGWMTVIESRQAIPPAYGEFIGNQAMMHIRTGYCSIRTRNVEHNVRSQMATTEAPPAPAEKKEKVPAAKRDYSIVRRGTGTIDVLIDFLKEYVAEGTETEVTVLVGKAHANTPNVAMKALADHVDLDGDYETVADQSYKKFTNLKTENKRKVVGL